MSWDDYEKKEFMEKWPWIYPIQLFDIVLEEAAAIDYGPSKGVRWDVFLAALTEKITKANGEILLAKNRDDVNAAESRLKMLKEEKEKIVNGFWKISIERLRLKFEIGYGFRDSSGVRKIIKPTDWLFADVNWDERKVVTETGRYADVRFLRYSRVPLHYKKLSPDIQYAVNRDLRDAGEFVPYIPGEEEHESDQMEEVTNDTPDLNKSYDNRDIQLPKDKKQDKQATQARNERWLERDIELRNADPKLSAREVSAQIAKEHNEKFDSKVDKTTVEREIRRLKKTS